MARRPHFSRDNRRRPNLRINERIRINPILLIDENDNRIGETPTHEALARARDLGLDLVEVAPDARPPVCRIMNYGKFKYEQAKKERANKAKSKSAELREVRLGRSLKIDPHDIGIRLRKAREFLLDGDKVLIIQNFRGREMQHQGRGYTRMKEITETLSDISKVEVPPRMMGRRMSMILGPDKAKIDLAKRRLQKQKPAQASPDEAEPAKDGPPASETKDPPPEVATPPQSTESPAEPIEAKQG